MIRAHRVIATAQDDASLVSGWNIAPNVAYILRLFPGAASCGVLLFDEDNILVATGAALVGTGQPCILTPQSGQAIEMVDAEFGWHLLLTTVGTESSREIRINPQVDLPDEIHPVYGDDDMALARATAAIDEAAHYRDDVTVGCPIGLGAGLGDVLSVPVDGVAVVGQVESITWTATPDGTPEQAVIRRHVAIAPGAFVDPALPTLVDDAGTATSLFGTSGNVFVNDDTGLTVTAIDGLSGGVGVAVDGDNGGKFTVNADGSWVFDPDGDFGSLGVSDTQDTSVTYYASNGGAESSAVLTVTVSRANAAPIAIDDVGATAANATTSGNVLTNDTDADDDTLSVSKVSGSAANVGSAVAGSDGGLFTVSSNGEWTFDPNDDFDGLTGDQIATTSVTYHVSDSVAEDEGTLTVTVSAASSVPLALVASATAKTSSAGSGYYDVTLPSGIEPGDLVVIFATRATTGVGPVTVSPSIGWTETGYSSQNDIYDLTMRVMHKIMPDPVDTTVRIDAVNGITNIAVIEVWRNVDQDTPLDTAVVLAGSANSATVVSPSITTVTNNAVVIVAGVSAAASVQAAAAPPSGYADAVIDGLDSGTALTAGMAHADIETAGLVSPGSWSGFYNPCTSCSWAAATIALRRA